MHMAKSDPLHSAGENPAPTSAEPVQRFRTRASILMLRAALSENSISRNTFFGWWFSITSTLFTSRGDMFSVAKP